MKIMNEKGFTFLELIMVVAILGTLMAMAYLNYSAVRNQAIYDLVQADLNTIRAASRAYYMRYQTLPAALSDLVSSGFLDEEPDDKYARGQNQKYGFQYDGLTNRCTVWSRGKDGADNGGGAGDISLTFGP